MKNTNEYSEGEILRKNLLSPEKLQELREETLANYLSYQVFSELSITKQMKLQKWAPENYIDGEWKMRPAIME